MDDKPMINLSINKNKALISNMNVFIGEFVPTPSAALSTDVKALKTSRDTLLCHSAFTTIAVCV